MKKKSRCFFAKKLFLPSFSAFTIIVSSILFADSSAFSGETILFSTPKIKSGQVERFQRKATKKPMIPVELVKYDENSENTNKQKSNEEKTPAEENVVEEKIDEEKVTEEEKTTGEANVIDEKKTENQASNDEKNTVSWLEDYREACRIGKEQQKMVLIYFYDTNADSPYKDFETESLDNSEVQKLLQSYVCVRLPLNAKLSPIGENGEKLQNSEEKNEENIENKESTENSEIVVAKNDSPKIISETVTHASGKTQFTQKIIREENPIQQASFSQRTPQPPKRDMGSVAHLKDEKTDLTFPEITETMTIIQHPAFYEMLNTPGLTMIDYEHNDEEYFGDIVSVFPFLNQKPYTPEETQKMLTLPPGSVTQRSVIFAVRIHPDNPKSTDGELNETLENEAKLHSEYQAKIHLQGHHNFDQRFQRINRKLPMELWASEVCAESWKGQHLLESAIECVRCWRLSEGHWSAVVAKHPYYGYDMKLSDKGIWYATGIFAKWRHSSFEKIGMMTPKKEKLKEQEKSEIK